jgi:hypothetical protein
MTVPVMVPVPTSARTLMADINRNTNQIIFRCLIQLTHIDKASLGATELQSCAMHNIMGEMQQIVKKNYRDFKCSFSNIAIISPYCLLNA